MRPRFDVGSRISATRAIRNDGTYPDPAFARGAVLAQERERGTVVDMGVFLQDRLVYAVMFDSGRLVGCLEHELEGEERDQ